MAFNPNFMQMLPMMSPSAGGMQMPSLSQAFNPQEFIKQMNAQQANQFSGLLRGITGTGYPGGFLGSPSAPTWPPKLPGATSASPAPPLSGANPASAYFASMPLLNAMYPQGYDPWAQ